MIPEHFILSASDSRQQAFVKPQTVAEVGGIIREAVAQNRAIYPVGGQTSLDYGLPPTCQGIAIDLRALNQVIDYPARDMTITVQAGITISQLQELLATENQRLPVDVPFPGRATLGGALATNISGPRRYGFGTFRDYVIGITVVNDQGQEVKAGGRVVKNVAGYDLCKLYVGSLGTLGIITQVTLKLKPLPEQSTLVELLFADSDSGALLDRLHSSRTRPASISMLDEDPVTRRPVARGWVIWVGFEDNRKSVSWQVEQLKRELGRVDSELAVTIGRQLDDVDALPVWSGLTDFPPASESVLTFKANLLPRAVADFCTRLRQLPEKPRLQAEAGSGIVMGHIGGDLTLERAPSILTTLQQEAAGPQSNCKGNVIVIHCPQEWKAHLPVWGAMRGDVWLMRAIKEKLDPRGIFNPGRFVDGI